MNVSGISSALNGSERHLTKSLITKAQRWEERTFPGGELPKQEKRPDIESHPELILRLVDLLFLLSDKEPVQS